MPNRALINRMRAEAAKSPCRIIRFSASDGKIFSHNGEFNPDCGNCKRTEIIQQYPDCVSNHAEWGVLAKLNQKCKQTDELYIYCMTPDEKDYPFARFWCRTCAILIPMFGVKSVWMWSGDKWIMHHAKDLIKEVNKTI